MKMWAHRKVRKRKKSKQTNKQTKQNINLVIISSV